MSKNRRLLAAVSVGRDASALFPDVVPWRSPKDAYVKFGCQVFQEPNSSTVNVFGLCIVYLCANSEVKNVSFQSPELKKLIYIYLVQEWQWLLHLKAWLLNAEKMLNSLL